MTTNPRRGAREALKSPRKRSMPPRLTIVGVGASAGGLEAFTRLLEHLPSSTDTAFVFVQHLDPTHQSYLPDLLSRATKIPVVEARDGLAVRHNRIYVMPSNARMSITGEVLKLEPRRDLAGPHLPIDDFLRSLAEGSQNLPIGVVLSGAGTDGTLGLKAIKFAGGVTFAQDPRSAKHDGMPRSAIAAGCVDFVLPPEEIARELITIGTHPFWNADLPVSVDSMVESPARIDKIIDMVRASTGVDFTYYKRTTIQRRVGRRLVVHKIESLDDYVKFLRENPDEIKALFQDILIHVTSFFRERASFALLKKKVFPLLVKKRARTDPIRVWVPGCSTGEEAYSMAITLHEFLQSRSPAPEMQVFASDISESAIDHARLGIYPENIMADVSREHLRNYFVKMDGRYQISKTIRDCCVFAKQDVAKDPPFSRLDIISCRNVLIYLGPVLQKKVIPIFHYALKPSGFLVLGAAESIGRFSDLFHPFDRKHQIYTKKHVSYAMHYLTGAGSADLGSRLSHPRHESPLGVESASFDVQKEADRILLSRFAPAGVLVDEQMDILQFWGHTGPFLEPSPGAASLNLMKMTRRGLWSEARLAIQRAKKTEDSVRREGLSAEFGNEVRNVDIEVIPVRRGNSKPHAFMVLFMEKPLPKPVAPGRRAAPPRITAREENREIKRLKQELEATREYLQAVIDTQQATNEELKTANEEILSSNEELQSTNEELETAKEELQSTNEELMTLNEELRTRNAEASEALSDLNNVLNSADIPLVLLSSDLIIRRINSPAEAHLNLRATDVGRSIKEIRLRLDAPGLEEVIQRVLDSALAMELEVKDPDGRPYLLRVNPYRNNDNRTDGVVLRAVDLLRYKSKD